MNERRHQTRSRANPGGVQDILKVLGPDVQPHRGRKPPWFKVPAPGGPAYRSISKLIESENLHTVCQEAACPNIGECWQRGTATFMILGDTCTRRCGFCNVKTGKPTWNDPLEPARVARSVARMGLKHAVITIGQYLRPTERHLPIVRYWHPDEFDALAAAGMAMGFDHVAAGPLVRSSYHADEHVPQPEPGVGPLATG